MTRVHPPAIPLRANPRSVWTIALLAALALAGCREDNASFSAPGLETEVDAAGVSAESYKVVPAVLGRVYDAFGATEEGAIYDGLAQVAAGEALEALYLERIGALATTGLEPDQEIHEMELLGLSSRPENGAVVMSAKWRVLGTVGHAEHLHVRGNAYSADLTLEPVEDAWRLTGFTLSDVDRTDVGTTQLKSEGPWSTDDHEDDPVTQ
ncbi:hypothetical protein [Roseivivax sp. THAF40]|nr:hypothetical protein [Roseivivax sp. THAF40]